MENQKVAYTDKTGNLRDSEMVVLYHNGKIVKTFNSIEDFVKAEANKIKTQ